MRRASWVVALLCAACGSATEPATEPAPPAATPPARVEASAPPGEQALQATSPDAVLLQDIHAMIDRIALVRKLAPRTTVKGERLERPQVIARIIAKAEKEIPKQALEAQGELLRAFELIGIDYDFAGGIYGLIEQNVAGLYDHDTKTMVLLADLPQAAIEQTLAHELVHALQDQHYDLAKVLKYRAGETDRVTAWHALAEGDATSAMLEVAEGSAFAITPEQLRMAMVASVALSGSGGSTPRVLQASLVGPYVDGFAFVQALRQRGGWSEVDKAWTRPPTSTEQLLHLDKYDAAEPPLEVAEPPLPGEGWLRHDADVLGEQGLRQILAQWTSRQDAAAAAAGWGGDRYLVARRDGPNGRELAAAWHLRFDTVGDANEAAAAIRNAFSKPCSERTSLGPIAWRQRGPDLALVARGYRRSPDGRTATSTSTCPEARAWLDAILR